ncbi:MAG: cation:proton antiporter domain-containing protein, partial [Candidatus Njordarchaeales archaeon]
MQGTSIIIGSLILLAGFLAIELGLSTAILEIVMGFVGTNLLGLETIEWLDFIAIIGLVGLMFLAGYETDIDLMKKNISKNLITGLLSFSIPFIIIFTLAKFILNFEFFSSILISLGLSTTSLALVYSVLENMNVGDYSNLVIGGAMIADVTSMGILAVLVG